MSNNEMMNLELTRHDICRILTALTHVILDFCDEINNPETSKDRNEIAKYSLEMWERIKAEVDRQVDEQDKLNSDPNLAIQE